MDDLISRQAAIDALGERPMVWMDSDYEIAQRNQYDMDKLAIETVPSAQPEPKEIGYTECADAMLKMWIDNVLTDGEYNHIMDKLNKYWLEGSGKGDQWR